MNETTKKKGIIQNAMALANLALDKDDCYDTRFLKATLFKEIHWYDEVEEELKHALYHEENIFGMHCLMWIECILNHTFLAIELGEKIRKRKNEDPESWAITANNLVWLYIGERAIDKAQDLINECEQEQNPAHQDWITKAKTELKKYKSQIQA